MRKSLCFIFPLLTFIVVCDKIFLSHDSEYEALEKLYLGKRCFSLFYVSSELQNCVTTIERDAFSVCLARGTLFILEGYIMSKENLVCPICGEPTRVYMGNARKDRLCGKHADMLKAGELVLDDKGQFVNPKVTMKETPKEEITSDLTCIICGEPSNGKHFCYDCYTKYKDRAIDIRLKNLKFDCMLDEYGNLKFKCEDGRFVRSKSEKIISDFLFKYGIRTIYEKAVYYYPNENETITLHPDFYLPDYDCYIEHNGVNTKSYKANKSKTEEMYKSLGYKVIVTTEADLGDIEAKLKPALRIN